MEDSKPKTQRQTDLLEHALFYASKGWKVIPLHTPVHDEDGILACSCRKPDCKSIGKHPRLMHGLKDASCDPDQIRKWWDMWPDANVGVCTGSVSDDLVVVDVDVKHNGLKNWSDLREEKKPLGEIPDTPMVITGGGGMHYFFRGPPGGVVKNSASKITRGVDVRGEGGYVVAPPSEHASGRYYQDELSSDPRVIPLAEMPGWLLEAAVSDPTPTASSQTSQNIPPTAPGVVTEGSRNETLFKIGRSYRAKGLDEEAILNGLRLYNQTKCEPPLDDSEVVTIAKSAASKPAGTSNSKHAKAAVEATERIVQESGADEIKKSPDGPVVFARGDATELATRLLVDARGESPVAIVHDRGEFWRYEAHLGLWQPLRRMLMERHVTRYAGAPCGDKALKVSDGMMGGAVNVAMRLSDRPGFFDNAPPGIAFRNGFVSVGGNAEVQLNEHSPEYRARHGLESDWNTSLRAPRFARFLLDVFTVEGLDDVQMPDNERAMILEDRQRTIDLVMEFIGACLLGEATKHAIALVLFGETAANGKSTLIKIVKSLFPLQSVTSISPSEWGNRFYLAELALARLNAVSEMPTKEIAANDLFKSVISGDEVMVAKKFKDPFNMRPQAGHIFACNELPATLDQTEGFWRRFVVVPFDRTFAPSEQDKNLADRIIASELGAITVAAIKAAGRLRRQGEYTLPKMSIISKQRWKGESDPIRMWLVEKTKTCSGNCGLLCKERYSSNCSVNADPAYTSFREWCKESGTPLMQKRTFLIGLKRIIGQRRESSRRWYPVYLLSSHP